MRPVFRIVVLASVVLAALAVAPVQEALSSGPEGCVVTNPANPQYPNPCTYKATVNGGIAGAGKWKVTIIRGRKKIVFTDAKGPNQSIGVIKKGDRVTAQAVSAGSSVAVGNPCAQSIPGAC